MFKRLRSPSSGRALGASTFSPWTGRRERQLARRRWAPLPLHERRVQHEVGGAEAVFRRPGLVPIRVDQRRLAHLVETRALGFGQLDLDRGEVVAELRLGPAA